MEEAAVVLDGQFSTNTLVHKRPRGELVTEGKGQECNSTWSVLTMPRKDKALCICTEQPFDGRRHVLNVLCFTQNIGSAQGTSARTWEMPSLNAQARCQAGTQDLASHTHW